ncbi:MAG TPA: hypothetical protein VHK65_06665 [Candidatus Dormibacteraeota bacterium]|nr:hypothetical protein [Candidatus Dormibacteraeota bacterium]
MVRETTVPDLAHRAVKARVGVALLILADGMFAASMVAGNLYLKALNVLGQFTSAAEHGPAPLLGLGLALIMVASAGSYGWAARRLSAGDERRFAMGARVAVGLVAMALLAQIVLVTTLGFPSPLHASGSMTILLNGYHGVHLLITGTLGVMLLRRLANGRLVGQRYLVDVIGYWWYYVAGVAVVFWVAGLISQP